MGQIEILPCYVLSLQFRSEKHEDQSYVVLLYIIWQAPRGGAVCGEFCVLIGYPSDSGILAISCITSDVV